MRKQKLNNVIEPQMSFDQLYDEYAGKVRQIAAKYAATTNISYEDFYSIVLEALWKASMTYRDTKSASFNTWFYKIANNAALNLIKYHKRRSRDICNLVYIEDVRRDKVRCNDDDDLDWDVASDYSLEKEIVDSDLVTRIDEMIESVSSAKNITDTQMIEIVRNFRSHLTLKSLADSVGCHVETVRRKLRKLSKLYPQLRDYLEVS